MKISFKQIKEQHLGFWVFFLCFIDLIIPKGINDICYQGFALSVDKSLD